MTRRCAQGQRRAVRHAHPRRSRGQPGQIVVAAELTRSAARAARSAPRTWIATKVQDPYSLRCQPQVMGACLDLLRTASAHAAARSQCGDRQSAGVSATTDAVLSGGNFHAEPVAFAADQLALAVAEIGSIVERRIAILVDTKMSGLPPFLVRQQRRQFGLHDRAGDGRRAGRGEQGARAPGQRRQHPDLRQPGRPRVDGHLRRAAPARPWRTTPPASSPSSCWRRRRVLIFTGPLRSSSALEAVHRLLRRKVPKLCARPLLRAGHRRRAPAGDQRRTAGTCEPRPVRALAQLTARHAERPLQTFPTHSLVPGDSPLIISVPHAGTAVPQELAPRLSPLALDLPDTDWHVPALYDFAPELGATMIVARYTRYLIDLNRPPDDAALYTAAVRRPVFARRGPLPASPCIVDGTEALSAAEIDQRREQYWQPYHDALRAHLDETRRRFGYALLLDAHSIRSVVPRLFAGRLPDINVGTFDGRSCAAAISDAAATPLAAAAGFTQVFDGRFKGGYITRHYGQPAQAGSTPCRSSSRRAATWMSPARAIDSERATPLRELLRDIVMCAAGSAARRAGG